MNTPCKLFIQMSGAPGSGKSTLAHLLARSIDGVVINHDLIKSFFLENDTVFEQASKLTYAFQWVLAEDMIKQGRSVIIDSTCNFRETLDQGMTLAKSYDYEYKYVECRVNDMDLLDRRLGSRVPMRSQRTGIVLPPSDANRSATHDQYHAQFKKWIENPCRPAEGAIIVDSTSNQEDCLEHVLRQLVLSADVQAGNGTMMN
jgi:predicted kinase